MGYVPWLALQGRDCPPSDDANAQRQMNAVISGFMFMVV